MTDEECLNICEVAIKCFEHKHSKIIPAEPDFVNDVIKQIAKKEEERQAILIIIEALEKQMPKKVQKINKGCYVCLGNCPNCKNNITDYSSHRFCKECGQKLDWSDDA